MSSSEQPETLERGKFVTGSILRHIVVMTATSSVGLVSIFIVDFANLFYISLLGQQELAAAIGYAGTIMFFNISICIGITIGAIALVSRALGEGNKAKACKLSGSALLGMGLTTIAIVAIYFPFIDVSLGLIGATGETREIAADFLRIVVPSMPLLGLGMCAAGLLRSVGDAKRAMYVTLGSGIVAAVLDPLFIFTFELGVYGAAYVTIIARTVMVVIGISALIRVHHMLALPDISQFFQDTRALLSVAIPAILTNVATPVGNSFVTASLAVYGDEAVAGWAIIGRLIPVAFGFIFALSGAVGPIIGQNFGARELSRVRDTIIGSLYITLAYTLVMWLVVFLMKDIIINGFDATGGTARLIEFFINIVIISFLFNGALFVANAAFNNLGYATYSTVLNWGKATIGTVPFIWIGGYLANAEGVLAGQGVGAAVFGVLAIFVARHVLADLEKRSADGLIDGPPTPLWRSALSAFSSGKSAGLS